MTVNNKNKEIFSQQIVSDFIDKVTGNNIDRLVGSDPNDTFFVGKLTTEEEKSNMNSSKQFIDGIGVEFLVENDKLDDLTLNISPSGSFYYRVNPTLQEERDFIEKEFAKSNESKRLSIDEIRKELSNKKDIKKFNYEIVQVYNKFSINDKFDISLKITDIYDKKNKYGKKDFNNIIRVKMDKEIYNILNKENISIMRRKVTLDDVYDEDTWNRFINVKNEKIIPRWDFSIIVEVKPYSSKNSKVSVYLKNKTKMDVDSGKEIKTKKNILRGKKLITTLFNAGLNIEVKGVDLMPIELKYFEDDYKYDKYVYVVGNGCSADVKKKEYNYSRIETSSIPIYIQKKLKTKDSISVKFKELVESPIDVLNNISVQMEKELKSYKQSFKKKKNKLTDKGRKQFLKEIESFEFEMNRFKNGINIINNFEIIKKSFIHMNEAFSMNSKGYDSWRLFQIVFIVSLIPDICVCEYGEKLMGETCKIDDVDVLYFPTGGGKTEAFLGITIFTMFFDRFRNKNSGVSSIIKYPLRLLSVQQVQRVADIMAKAEIIRKKDDLLKDKDAFSLGYYVGERNTPNKIDKKLSEILKYSSQEKLNNEYKIIEKCPFCGSDKVDVVFNKDNLTLQHVCKNENCISDGKIPLYIVDNEIYRYLPTVIISTIDKIAAVSYQSNFKNILGEVKYKCSIHGYTSKEKCIEYNICPLSSNELDIVNIKDPAPTLLIQDELHLVRESLGAFDSHYETLFQYFIKSLTKSKKKIKIIGATATISSYEYQLKHLYGKNGIRFPCETPNINENFYSYIDETEINRTIIGYAPYAKSVISSVAYSMKYMKEILWSYYNEPQKIINIEGISISNKNEALEILKDYWFLLEYNNVKQDGNKIIGAIDTPINEELKEEGIRPFDYRKMTGDDSFQDVRKVLFDIENTEDVFNSFNLISATSMISHGVDADRFNNMIFFGMPGNTAEYIQAYSRVGRKYPGIVIVILRPTRSKDMSYLRYFVKFHEFKDILVDPVPINRWANKSIYKTLSGIMQAIILNYYENLYGKDYGSFYRIKNVQKAIKDNKITEDDMVEHILKSYKCISDENKVVDIGKQYKLIIEKNVKIFFEKVINTNFSNMDKLSDQINRILGEKVMNSLRDSEEQVIIALD